MHPARPRSALADLQRVDLTPDALPRLQRQRLTRVALQHHHGAAVAAAGAIHHQAAAQTNAQLTVNIRLQVLRLRNMRCLAEELRKLTLLPCEA